MEVGTTKLNLCLRVRRGRILRLLLDLKIEFRKRKVRNFCLAFLAPIGQSEDIVNDKPEPVFATTFASQKSFLDLGVFIFPS